MISRNHSLAVILGNPGSQEEPNGEERRTGYPEMRMIPVDIAADPLVLLSLARETAAQDGFVQFVGQDVEIENPDWAVGSARPVRTSSGCGDGRRTHPEPRTE